MRRIIYSISIAVAAGLVAASVASALTPKKIAFTAKYAGNATAVVDGSSVTITANGTGSGTLIGTGAIAGNGTGDSSQQPCVPFGGAGTMKGAGGTISFRVTPGASGCGDEGGHNFTVQGHFLVLKATGKLLKAKGTLKFTGTYSHDDGSFTVKVFGTLVK